MGKMEKTKLDIGTSIVTIYWEYEINNGALIEIRLSRPVRISGVIIDDAYGREGGDDVDLQPAIGHLMQNILEHAGIKPWLGEAPRDYTTRYRYYFNGYWYTVY